MFQGKEDREMSEKRCYTVQELQEILGVSRPTIYNLLKKKEFRWIQLDGGKYRISKKSFDDGLDNNEHDKEYYFGDRRFDEQPERE